jgi:hypothetical protein
MSYFWLILVFTHNIQTHMWYRKMDNFNFFLFFVLGWGTLWHLQSFLQYTKYIILEFNPSAILLQPLSSPVSASIILRIKCFLLWIKSTLIITHFEIIIFGRQHSCIFGHLLCFVLSLLTLYWKDSFLRENNKSFFHSC